MNPNPAIPGDISIAMTPPSPIPEPQSTTNRKDLPPNVFKAGSFSEMNLRTGDKPPRPPGFKPKSLQELGITDLYPDDEPTVDASPNPAPGIPLEREPSPFSLPSPLIISASDHEFFEEHSSFLNSLPEDPPSAFLSDPDLFNSETDLLASSSLSSSYHPLPLPAVLNQQHLFPDRPLLPLYNPSTSSLTPSEILLLKPQVFFSFLWEYTASFVSYVLDVNVGAAGRYGLGRTRAARRDTSFYGERGNGGMGEGHVDEVLMQRERDRDRGEGV
jgi:hypothetical protein